MILQYWQVKSAMKAAKEKNPKTYVGTRINYQFCHETDDGQPGICGLFGWILEHKNPDAPKGQPMELVLALDTTIDDFYVTEEVKALWSRENLAGDCTNINEAEHSQHIDDVIYGKDEGEQQ